MGIQQIIGSAYGGGVAEWAAVERFLKENYLDSKAEKERIEEAKKRDEYYNGGGDFGIDRLIQLAFKDPVTQRLRTEMVRWAKWNNVIRRVASELATVYSEPARRTISGDEETYRSLVDAVDMDAVMRDLDEKLVYHEEAWISYRVRKDTLEPVVDVTSPAAFHAVHHPADRTRLIAIIMDQKSSDRGHDPRWLVWTSDETFQIDGSMRVMGGTIAPNPLGELPGVLASARPASVKGRLLSQCPAADLVAAHEAVWFQGVLLLKESKSANRQTYYTGDTSAATMGQTGDTEADVVLPEGVTTQAIDRGMDLKQFMDTATHILEEAAANHGLPPSVLHQRDAASGAEIHLRRIPIRELRKKRIPIMRRVERSMAGLMSRINATDLPASKFDPAGFRIDFGEVQQPLTEAEQDQVFEGRRRLGLTNTLEEIRRRNPDLRTDDEAEQVLKDNVEIETKRVIMMQGLMAANGSMGAEPGAPTPQDNGQQGQDASSSQDQTP